LLDASFVRGRRPLGRWGSAPKLWWLGLVVGEGRYLRSECGKVGGARLDLPEKVTVSKMTDLWTAKGHKDGGTFWSWFAKRAALAVGDVWPMRTKKKKKKKNRKRKKKENRKKKKIKRKRWQIE